MSTIEADQLLAEISPDAPSGENLEYDAAYGDLERLAQGRAEQQIGDQTIEAQPPDWQEVEKRALDLLARTKDLRVALYLIRAQLHTEGLPGFSKGLEYLRGLVERYWETVHPQLDPNDDNDPTTRVNAINGLTHPTAVLNVVRSTPLTDSRTFGRISYRDLLVAKGELLPAGNSDSEPPDMARIDGAFSDTDAEALQALAAAAQESIAHAEAIDATVSEQVGAALAPNLEELMNLLKGLERVLSDRTGGGAPAAEAPAEPAEAPPAAAAPAHSGDIGGPQDVIAALDRICAYYEKNEPSSPVPLLMRRAKRLVSKNFMEIIGDLAPDTVKQIEKISGNDSGKT